MPPKLRPIYGKGVKNWTPVRAVGEAGRRALRIRPGPVGERLHFRPPPIDILPLQYSIFTSNELGFPPDTTLISLTMKLSLPAFLLAASAAAKERDVFHARNTANR
ncbi:hypothetical protein THAOC_24750, partial [Thalassiosira oceanica]